MLTSTPINLDSSEAHRASFTASFSDRVVLWSRSELE
jgi:hypothetical protein